MSAPGGWQPIESCPPDQFVLLCGEGWRKATIGRIEDRQSFGRGRWFYDEEGDPFYSDEAPTHWRPLPDPPDKEHS